MTHQQMWQTFSRETGIEAPYEAWAFGCDTDELARLVLEGRKTATAGLYFWYERECLDLPKLGSYSIVLDSKDNACCVIRNTKVSVIPFCEVGEDHAFREGEGDRSLAYWREVHERFFSEELESVGVTFHRNMDVVCEEFEKVFG